MPEQPKRERNALARSMRAEGISFRVIASELEISKTRAIQICKPEETKANDAKREKIRWQRTLERRKAESAGVKE